MSSKNNNKLNIPEARAGWPDGQEDDRVLREEPVNASRAQTPGESGSAAPFGGFVSNTL